MKVNAALFNDYLAGAQVYYALRALDKSGTGWLICAVKDLQQLTGLSYQSVQRITNQLLDMGWFYSLKKFGGKLSVAYKSASRVVKANPLDISINKRMLRDKQALKARIAHAYALAEQQRAEAKLNYLIGRGKLLPKEIVSSDSYRKAIKMASQKPKQDSSPSSPKVLGGYEGTLFVKEDLYTVGVNQTTLGEILGCSRQTVSKRMKSVNKLRVYKITTLDDPHDGLYIYCDELKETVDAYRPMPNVYEKKNILHSQIKKLKQKAKLIQLSRGQMEVAKLCAIYKGYGYSESGGIQLVLDTGVERFKRNTYKVKDMHVLPWEQEQDLYSSPAYLVSVDEDDDD